MSQRLFKSFAQPGSLSMTAVPVGAEAAADDGFSLSARGSRPQSEWSSSMAVSTMKTTEEIVGELLWDKNWGENFELLYKRYYVRLLRFAQGFGFSEQDAEELVNDTFLAVSRDLIRLRDAAKFESWMLAIARNKCVNEFKRRLRQKYVHDFDHESLESAAGYPASHGENPEELLERNEVVKKVHAALEKMPSQQRRCVKLHYLDGLSTPEIAEVLGINSSTVRVHLCNGREYLRKELGPEITDSLTDSGDSDE